MSNFFQKILRTVLLLTLGGVVGFFIGTREVRVAWQNYRPTFAVQSKAPPKGVNVDLSLFWDVWERVAKDYADKKVLIPEKMLYGAISGMVQSLGDPYTVFLNPEQNKEVKQELAGQFEGIGAQLGVKDKKIVVVAPLSGSPAQRAGIKAGDVIAQVEGVTTINWTLPEAVVKIRGPKGTTVKLTILREEETKPLEISVVRETIQVKSAEGGVKYVEVRESKIEVRNEPCKDCSGVGYIKLSQFGDETNNEWLITVNEIASKIKQDGKIRSLVLDLRNNSGGYLNGAVFIASEFLKEGTVVIQERGDGTRQNFSVNRRGLLTEIPLVVLINRGSASASEIVAAALRENRKAKLVGENSFGKGTIQEAQDLGGGAGLHITVAKWLTPSGVWVNGKGLEPDIKVEPDEKDPTQDKQLEKAIEELIK